MVKVVGLCVSAGAMLTMILEVNPVGTRVPTVVAFRVYGIWMSVMGFVL